MRVKEFFKKLLRQGMSSYDESIISLIPYVGKTWALPNKKPIVRVSGKRGQKYRYNCGC